MNYKIFNLIKNLIPIIFYRQFKDELTITIMEKNLILTLNGLKKHANTQFKILSCISGVDYLNTKYRFNVVYDLLSLTYNARLRIKVCSNEFTNVSSVVSIYLNANWWEREIWDMYGIFFYNHPDLRRILTDYGFEGFPLRKDYPLSGYTEVRYDYKKKRVVVEPVELAQELRYYTFENPWQ